MRFREFKPVLDEGGASGAKRYSSEIGLLYAFIGNGEFDPSNPETSLPAQSLQNPEATYKSIKSLVASNFDQSIFQQWVGLGQAYKAKIEAKLGEFPAQFTWAGGKNKADNAADVGFVGSSVAGVSIKADGGITLANLTPKAIGIEKERGMDTFSQYAKVEFDNMKQRIVADVLELAKSKPDEALSFKDPKYNITYMSETDTFKCAGKKVVDWPAEKILASIEKNAHWQRVFGDWFQANWDTKKSYAAPLFQRVAAAFEATIENHLAQSAQLANILRFSATPYFYATSNGLYYVPTIESVRDLESKGVFYGNADGTGQVFKAKIGRPDSEAFATMDIYIRYANGLFETNPTVRVQNLANPQFISWELL